MHLSNFSLLHQFCFASSYNLLREPTCHEHNLRLQLADSDSLLVSLQCDSFLTKMTQRHWAEWQPESIYIYRLVSVFFFLTGLEFVSFEGTEVFIHNCQWRSEEGRTKAAEESMDMKLVQHPEHNFPFLHFPLIPGGDCALNWNGTKLPCLLNVQLHSTGELWSLLLNAGMDASETSFKWCWLTHFLYCIAIDVVN